MSLAPSATAAAGTAARLARLPRPFRVLAIETSCDDTAVAIVDSTRRILAETVLHQHALHAPHQGIVPRLASRAHRTVLPTAIRTVLAAAGLAVGDLDALAATRGPGIAGSLAVGFDAARLLAAATRRPLYPVHHMARRARAAAVLTR